MFIFGRLLVEKSFARNYVTPSYNLLSNAGEELQLYIIISSTGAEDFIDRISR